MLGYAVSPSLTHAAVMVFGFLPLFFSGFLFTAGPRNGWACIRRRRAKSWHRTCWNGLGLAAVAAGRPCSCRTGGPTGLLLGAGWAGGHDAALLVPAAGQPRARPGARQSDRRRAAGLVVPLPGRAWPWRCCWTRPASPAPGCSPACGVSWWWCGLPVSRTASIPFLHFERAAHGPGLAAVLGAAADARPWRCSRPWRCGPGWLRDARQAAWLLLRGGHRTDGRGGPADLGGLRLGPGPELRRCGCWRCCMSGSSGWAWAWACRVCRSSLAAATGRPASLPLGAHCTRSPSAAWGR